MFQAAFSVDSDIDAIGGGDVMLDCRDIQAADWMGDRITVKSYAYEPGFAPEGKQIVQALIGLQEDAYDYWMELYKNKDVVLAGQWINPPGGLPEAAIQGKYSVQRILKKEK